MESYVRNCPLWAFDWNPLCGILASRSLVRDVSIRAFSLWILFEINSFSVFHLGSFVQDPRLQPFVQDHAFVVRRLATCLQTADRIFPIQNDTKNK